jgi:hypothetical protein
MKTTTLILLSLLTLAGFAQEDKLFDVFNVRSETDGSVVVYAVNDRICDESVLITFTALKNMKADVELPFSGVVPAGADSFKLFTLSIKDLSKESQLGYIVKHCHGDVYNKKHDNSYVYTIPYKAGDQWPLEQGYGGKFSHYMHGKTHALDFTMPEGTTICAARDGIVLEVKDDTMANYYHLKKGGSKVKVGDKVAAGQAIGLSGNTGWSSGPHLHFQVFTFTEDMEVKSIPTKFLQEEGKAIKLEKNRAGYVSVHR